MILISQVARLHLLEADQMLNPEQLVTDIRQKGKTCDYLEDADSICSHLTEQVAPDDVVCTFSNGTFGDLHGKLEKALRERFQ